MCCWRRLLRVPWTARGSNQSALKEINPEYSLEGLMLSWHSNTLAPDTKSQLIGKDPDAGEDWRQKQVAEDETVRSHNQLNGHESEQAAGGSGGLGILAETAVAPTQCSCLENPMDGGAWWAAAHQVLLSLTISWSLPKFMSIGPVMPSRHLILWFPFCFCPRSFLASGTFPMS